MKKRILWIDILNVLACFGVLLMLVSNEQNHEWGENKDLFDITFRNPYF